MPHSQSQFVQDGTNCEQLTLDTQTITYTSLGNLLSRIFNIKGEFTVSFKKDKVYIPLTSDWDLDGAISEASKPYLSLAIELQPIDKNLEEWDIICPADIPAMGQDANRCCEDRKSLAGSILSQMETAFNRVQRAFSVDSSIESLGRPPMDEREFRSFLDSEGRVVNHRDLHMAVYRGGLESSLRPEVWPHLLNVYPHGLTTEERNVYMNSKCEQYYNLRFRWQHLMQAGTIPEVLQDITTMVRKDVRRTDRNEKFYSGSDDNDNVKALFNILTTYAVNHPNVSYCQGMSDLLSPILYIMQKESVAYVCFCALMKRTHTNFRLDGRSMKIKFRHLQKMLRFYDQELYLFLKDQEALDLLFCYRWLLLELKREFPYNDMLNMMEIVWASLPPRPPHNELDIYDVKFPTAAICSTIQDKMNCEEYVKLDEDYFALSKNSYSQSFFSNTIDKKVKKWERRVRRESMARSKESDGSSEEEIRIPVHYRKRKYRSYIVGKLNRVNLTDVKNSEFSIKSCKIPARKNSIIPGICQSWTCGEFEENREVTEALCDAREFLRVQWCYSNTINEIQLNNWLNGKNFEITQCAINNKGTDTIINDAKTRQRHGSNDSNYGTISDDLSDTEDISEKGSPPLPRRTPSDGYQSDEECKEIILADDEDDEYDDYEDYSDEDDDNDFLDSMAGKQYLEVQTYFDRKRDMLPPPHELGDGNPYLLFLCLSMIQSHREEILKKNFDFNELGIYFDKLVRKHRLSKVVSKSQKMFRDYLSMGWDVEDKGVRSCEPDKKPVVP
nr:TBC1 domain family member 25 isoform X2 [Parasteatoda tepidariorum]